MHNDGPTHDEMMAELADMAAEMLAAGEIEGDEAADMLAWLGAP